MMKMHNTLKQTLRRKKRMRVPKESFSTMLVAIVACFLFASPGFAASSSLIRMTGVPGNSQVSGFSDWVEVLNFAASADYVGAAVDFRPVQVSKFSDETDPQIFEFLVKQTVIEDVCVLSYSTGGSGQPIKRTAIGLKNAKVSNMTPVSTTDGVEQTFTLTYDQISVISYSYDNGGNPTGQQAYCADAITGGACPGGILSCPTNN